MRSLARKLLARLRRRESPRVLAQKIATSALALLRGRYCLRACDALGPGARCFGCPHVGNEGEIRIGKDFGVGSTFGATSLVTAPHAALLVGDGVTINYGTSIRAYRGVTIGDRVLVGPHCVIEDADAPGDAEAAPITIGDDVWLAAHVVVRPGARIGAGAVIAAGSVVEGDIPPNAVASGVPAHVLRVRDRRESKVCHEAVA